MAFNPSPMVKIARDFAKKFGKKQVIIIFIGEEQAGFASYGENKSLCDDAKRLGDEALEAVLNNW